jgi:hypothetical protein
LSPLRDIELAQRTGEVILAMLIDVDGKVTDAWRAVDRYFAGWRFCLIDSRLA